MKTIYTLLFLLATSVAFAQSTTLTPGTLLPVMTTAQRTTLASPSNGMLVFDTGTQSYWYRQSGTWVELSKSGSTANYWQLTGLGGNEIKNTNSGGFWSANPTTLSIYANDLSDPPTSPIVGEGTRLMWIPSRSAFRVGTVSATYADRWSAAKIGLFSFATGLDTQASAGHSIAMGNASEARGSSAIAIGYHSIASGMYSTAIGFVNTASGSFSTALGHNTTASGDFATALGYEAIASGDYSATMGRDVDTNNQRGAVMIGDSNPLYQGVTIGGAPDQFVARFNNGYYLITSGNTNRTGAHMLNGQSAWSALSDSTRKEKIVLADGESFLLKLRNLRLGSWNYKKQGAKPERFYGPMAQEIFAAFGKDKYGTIGNDTTVSTLNMDGLLFIFSQALEKRTQDLQAENEQLKAIIQKLGTRLESLEAKQNGTNTTNKSLSQTDK